MPFDQVCRKCNSSQLQKSSIHNILEFLIAPLFLIYRCQSCYTRQAKLRFIAMGSESFVTRSR